MTHTKGPWSTDCIGMYIYGKSIGGCQMIESQFPVAQTRGWGHLGYLGDDKAVEIQKANANLIAAAPELLEALENAKSMYPNGTDCEIWKSIIKQTESAIAKARGQ